jgi:hypothetical protein
MEITNFQRTIFVEARHREKIYDPNIKGDLEPRRLWRCDSAKCPKCSNSALVNFYRTPLMEIEKNNATAEKLWQEAESLKQKGFTVIFEHPL